MDSKRQDEEAITEGNQSSVKSFISSPDGDMYESDTFEYPSDFEQDIVNGNVRATTGTGIIPQAEEDPSNSDDSPAASGSERLPYAAKGFKTVPGSAATEEKKKRTKKRYESYSTFIYKLFKQINPNIAITRKAINILDELNKDLLDRIANEASKLMHYSNTKTLTSREIQTALALVLPEELGKYAKSEGEKAVSKYRRSMYKSS